MSYKTYKVTFSEMGSHCLEQLAAGEFRTVERLLEILVYEGVQFYQHEREFSVRKKPEHMDPECKMKNQYYTCEEIIEFFKPEIK